MEILIKVKMKCQMQQLYHLFFVTESVGRNVCACLSPLNVLYKFFTFEFCIQINSIKTFVCIYNVNIEKKKSGH